MKLLLVLIFIISSAMAQECETITRSELEALINETRNTYFPELSKYRIAIEEFHADAYFLQAQPKKSLRRASRREYEIQVNPMIYHCSPGHRGLEAIIVHELEHIRDYTMMSTTELAAAGVRYITSKKWRTKYERATDMKVLEKGLASGLIDYRNWIYQQLTPEELAKKQRYYLTPDEIRALSIP